MVAPFAFSGGDEDPLEDLPPANEGAWEGAHEEDLGANGFFDEGSLPGGTWPTDGAPSPLYGAQPYTQQLLRFEEFGTLPMPETYGDGYNVPFPSVPDAQSCPNGPDIDRLIASAMWPECKEMADMEYTNPWESVVEDFLGRDLITPPADGRPPGTWWSHQRWDEFYPEVHFQTAQTGARRNNGLRDTQQAHQYAVGEFAPGGLYHNTVGAPGFDGTTSGIDIRFHPNMPIQDPLALWTFDGTLPPKMLRVRYGETILLRHYNFLPVDPAANYGFGLHTIATHEHNGHNPAESDGYTNAYFFPGQYYDYRWPMALAGHDTVNTNATDLRAGTPDGNGGITPIPGDWRETMSTHWFHDHMLDFTAQNVYKGNAAMMNYYSALDRGNEAIDDGVNLRFPSGTDLDWGNRDYDVNLLIADKAWDADGQLWFNIFNTDGFLGDQLLTNWLYKPYMDVRARKYRFRLLNGSVSRYIKVALVDEFGNRVPFHMIANDGNIMEHAVAFDGTLGTRMGELPDQGIAERYDIIVDFSQFAPGTKLYFVNLLEHDDAKGPNERIPLGDVLSGEWNPVVDGGEWTDDPCVGKFMELRVHAYDGVDQSMDPAEYVRGGKTMIPLARPTAGEMANARRRHFEFGRSSGTDSAPWTIKTDGGSGFGMDPRRITAAPNLGDLTEEGQGNLEIWTIENGTGGGWAHPVHIHFEEGIILSRDGAPPPEHEVWARKDLYRVGPLSSRTIEIALRFREFAGTYMEHCHNTQHEDHAMLMRWDLEAPGQVSLLPAPIPTWDGVEYVNSVALPTSNAGDASGYGDGGNGTIGSGGGGTGGGPIVVNRANVNPGRGRWQVRGTAPAPTAGGPTTVDVHVGSDTDGPLLGTAKVNKKGRWKLTVRGSDIELDPTPAVTVVPDVGDAVLGVALDVKKPKPQGGGTQGGGGLDGETAGTSTDD